MRKMLGALALATLTSACGGGGGVLGRDRPDEFAVSRQAPLVIPPDFNAAPARRRHAHQPGLGRLPGAGGHVRW